jgi:hypothetical protein
MGARLNKIFTGYQLCQLEMTSSLGLDVALDPNRPSPSPRAQANGQLVVSVMGVFGLVFSLGSCISALFRHVSHRE